MKPKVYSQAYDICPLERNVKHNLGTESHESNYIKDGSLKMDKIYSDRDLVFESYQNVHSEDTNRRSFRPNKQCKEIQTDIKENCLLNPHMLINNKQAQKQKDQILDNIEKGYAIPKPSFNYSSSSSDPRYKNKEDDVSEIKGYIDNSVEEFLQISYFDYIGSLNESSMLLPGNTYINYTADVKENKKNPLKYDSAVIGCKSLVNDLSVEENKQINKCEIMEYKSNDNLKYEEEKNVQHKNPVKLKLIGDLLGRTSNNYFLFSDELLKRTKSLLYSRKRLLKAQLIQTMI